MRKAEIARGRALLRAGGRFRASLHPHAGHRLSLVGERGDGAPRCKTREADAKILGMPVALGAERPIAKRGTAGGGGAAKTGRGGFWGLNVGRKYGII